MAVIIVCPIRACVRQDLPPARIELGQDVVEQEEWRRRQQLRFCEQEGKHGEPLLALRAVLAQIALAAPDQHVVEMWADAGCATLEVAVEPRVERFARRRLSVVPESRGKQAELLGALRERRPEHGERLPATGHELCSEHGDLLRPRVERVRREAELHTAQRGVSLRKRGEIIRRAAARAGNRRASARSKYALRAAGPPFTTVKRSGVNTSVDTSRRSDSADGSFAPFTRASFAWPWRSVTASSSGAPLRVPSTTTRAAVSPKRISCASCRVRGEKPCVTTCSDSRRLVLPTPLRPTTSTIPGSSARSSDAYERYWRS